MQSLGSRLPPLKSLVAFEASARHLSLTRAAQELDISREAVSRQIRVLETYLGVKLFDRLHRAIALTPCGKQLQQVVQQSLENIAYVSDGMRRPTRAATIMITCTIAIASFWLTPRLANFRSKYPDVELHVAVSDEEQDLIADGIDIGLRYGDGNWPGLDAFRLFDVNLIPVCSPDYLEHTAPLNDVDDLLSQNLINLDGASHASENWWWWLKRNGVAVPDSFKTSGFDNYDNVIRAAIDSQGVALGYDVFVADCIAQNRLVQPIEAAACKESAVFLVIPSAIRPAPWVQNFVNWILEEAAEAPA